MPDAGRDVRTLEPFVRMEILTPSEYNGVSEKNKIVIFSSHMIVNKCLKTANY